MIRFFLFLILLCVTACSKSQTEETPPILDKISLSYNSLSYSNDGEVKKIGVNSTAEWILSGHCEWCTPSLTKGNNGETIAFTVVPNETPVKRSTSYTFICGNASARLDISQTKAEKTNISCTQTEFDYNGGSAIVTIKSNISGLHISHTTEWPELEHSTTSNDGIFDVITNYYNIPPYDEYKSRSFTVYAWEGYYHTVDEITITQTGKPDAIIFFSDNSLKENLLQYDKNKDGEISLSEAFEVHDIRVSNKSINSVNDIKHFPNVGILWCDNNIITSIDLNNHPGLHELHCFDCRITDLNIAHTHIHTLRCQNNYIETFNISENCNLYDIDCSNNKITSLDLTGCSNLFFLDCRKNPITSLNITDCTNLVALSCGDENTNIAALDISQCNKLQTLICESTISNMIISSNNSSLTTLSFKTDASEFDCSYCENLSLLCCNRSPNLEKLHIPSNIRDVQCSYCSFQTLNLKNCPFLKSLHCNDNKLTELDLSDCPNIEYLVCHNNPNLKTIWLKKGQIIDEVIKSEQTKIEYK